MYAEPVITVYGSGDITLMIGASIVELEGVSSSIVLDCALKEAYQGSTLQNEKMTGEFPRLVPGLNGVSWVGNVSRLIIRPNWRYL